MKLTILATAAAAALALVSASTAEAGPRYGGHSGGGGGYSSGRGFVAPSYGGHHRAPSHCAPVYKVHTVEVSRYSQCRTAYTHCGRPYTYHVTVVTYCDHYSNGTTRTWSRTFS